MPAPPPTSPAESPPSVDRGRSTAADRTRAWQELRAAPVRGAAFLARAWAAIPIVEVSLRVLGYQRTLGWIERVPSGRSGGKTSLILGERLVAAAYRAHPTRGDCLPRSLVQYLLHRRDGTGARFVIGVRRPGRDVPLAANDPGGARIEAHAWVEGAAGAPEAAQSFAPIFDAGDI